MAIRRADVIELRGGPGTLGRFQSVELQTSLVQPMAAKFVIGDDRAWSQLKRDISPGAEYELAVNGIRLLKGRVVSNEVPAETGSGVTIELSLTTKLSDAQYSSADPDLKVENVTLKDYILALFAQHGYTGNDFAFATRANVDLITGAPKTGGLANPDLSLMNVVQARAQMPETVLECAGRHAMRHGMMLWDMPDGRIACGQPDDSADPNFILRCRRSGPAAQQNNALMLRKIIDWREVASEVSVYGVRKGRDGASSSLRSDARDEDVSAVAGGRGGHFFRPIRLPTERAKNPSEAEKVAKRELAARQRRKDGYEAEVDGWTYWNGQRSIIWAIGGVVSVDADLLDDSNVPFMVWRASYRMNTADGQRVALAILRRGLWDLGGMD